MNQVDVAIVVGAAGLTAVLLILGFMRRSRTPEEGLRKLRLLVNVLLLGFYYSIFGVALALFGLGLVRDQPNYWLGAIAFLAIALLLFRDLSAPRRNPFREWFSRSPMSERVRGLERETGSLFDELDADEKRRGSRPDEPSPDAEGREEVRPDGTRTRTWTFEFHWPPRKRGS